MEKTLGSKPVSNDAYFTFENAVIYQKTLYLKTLPSEIIIKQLKNYTIHSFEELKSKDFANQIVELDEVISHHIDLGYSNIGHYFNDHFYSLYVCHMKQREATILLNVDRHYLSLNRPNCIFENESMRYRWPICLFSLFFGSPLIQDNKNIYYIKKLFLPCQDRFLRSRGEFGGNFVRDIRDHVLRLVSVPETAPDLLQLYSRANGRSILNKTQLLGYLETKFSNIRGIESYEGLSFADQVKLFFKTKVLLSPWGANLTNCIFMQPGSVIIEMRHRGYPCSWWENMGKIFEEMGIRHIPFYHLPHVDSSARLDPRQLGFEVDISKLNDMITQNLQL